MPDIKVTPLGAGQDVGRSCLLLSMGGKNIMLDCGMHMGFNDERRFPDFSYIVPEGPITSHIDCVIISHFHLDHCGALPYMSEIVGYMGPIYMTHPTKAIAPILLEDMRKVAVERKGESNFFTTQMIKDCMKKVTAVTLHQSVMVDYELEIKAYYAGHVLGAAMFWIRVGSQSVVYTGDFNMTPDRHLGAAWIDKCRPDLLITESTYATTIRDSKRCRERDFLKKVHECVARGGKVLIPVFALGRAQELCILLETYWERMNLKYPIYFALGLTEKANTYYKMFITWTNQKIRKTFVHRNMFEFKHIKAFDKGYIDNPGAMVVFATPGMLHAGLSLQIFKKWAPNENNMVIMPGYCVQGTVGYKVLAGAKKIEFENRQIVEVKMSVEYMSFSAHADAKEHCGALPYMTEIIGFNGPIYMTHPTKAIVPILLEELRKLNLENRGRINYFSTQVIKNCMKKVTAIDLHQSVMVDNELEIKAYYAGHVLGAAMFWLKVGSQTVVYTGDFNMNPDRHLGAAWIDKCQPDLLIAESTFATANPNARRCRNRDFLKHVHDCMSKGGKVLIPVFVLGRAQELCILLDTYWEKMNLSYPIYFASESLTARANSYYNMFVKWTNQKIHKSNAEGNVFEFKHILSFDRSYIYNDEPMVVLATNGMLQQGLSVQIFKEWAHDENNMVIFPDICMKGTLGHKIVAGTKEIEFSNKEVVKVKLKVQQMCFDAVADAKGIMQLIQKCAPKNVVLVHASHENLQLLRSKIKNEINVDCNILTNGETCTIETLIKMPTEDDLNLLKNGINTCKARGPRPTPIKRNAMFTIHVAEENRIVMMNIIEACKENYTIHESLKFCAKYKFDDPNSELRSEDKLYIMFKEKLKDWTVTLDESSKIVVESVQIKIISDEKDPSQKTIFVSWCNRDEDIAFYILEVLSNLS